jgi:hypothetical protein
MTTPNFTLFRLRAAAIIAAPVFDGVLATLEGCSYPL